MDARSFDADVVVVGAGIVGLAAARALSRAHPGAALLVLDKEDRLAAHQSGHNSGVIHSGIYYRPGSQKATMVPAGRRALLALCAEHGVAHDVCGKVIVATDRAELPALRTLYDRAGANGVDAEVLDPAGLRALEPNVAGVAALRVPGAGIVDFGGVCAALAAELSAAGGAIRLATPVTGVREGGDGVVVETGSGVVRARWMVNCAGLQSDRVAALTGAPADGVRIVPFRGEYYELVPERRGLVRNLVYPVPDPRFPFLGVHFTRMIDGSVHAGPNAVVALSREGYDWRTIDRRDVAELVRNPGFWRLAGRYWRTGSGELVRSASKAAFVRALRRLVPDVRGADLVPAGAGVRAQALSRDGLLLDDFVIAESARVVNVVNAPSPAATASLQIGRAIAERLGARMAPHGT